MVSAVSVAALLVFAVGTQGVNLRTANTTSSVVSSASGSMNLAARQFMEVDLGPFASAAEACDYCFSSFTKEGQPPAGPVAPFCVCMAYPASGKYNMFCATPPSAAGYIAKKKGCRCKAKDMEAMGKTTCSPIA